MEKELNHKEKEKDEMTKKSLENMSSKVPYYTPNKILISVSQRSKIESAEQLEENKRENGVLRTIYQRETEIPTAPIETATAKPGQVGNIQFIPASKYGHFPTVIKLSDEDETKDEEEKELESYTQQASSYQPQSVPQFHSMTPPDMSQTSQMMPPTNHMSMPPPPPSMSQPLISHMPQQMMGMPQNIPMMPMNQMYMPYPPNQNYQMPQMGPYGPMMNQPQPQPHRMQPSYQPQTMQFPTNDLNRRQVIYNPITKKPLNYKTMPCRKFHSNEGCERGDNCHFIHDFQYQGRPIPNFQEWKNSNQERLQNLMASKQDESAPSYYPPMNYPPDYNKY
ncbi:unnamed protein product [Blepharisma stoltei]|uniref:C3H1-type domain-containing protein n=1 Tax=Blepharisma stoltei TaxID=1481888 RepID=A0AAU9JHS8_9CILI|nr:unnamed protein product [Blepharisma stoltei]